MLNIKTGFYVRLLLSLFFLTAVFTSCDDIPDAEPIDPNFGTDRFDSRKRETALGDMVCDGMVWYFNNVPGIMPDDKPADFGVINGGIFVSGLPKINITSDMVAAILQADILTYIDLPGSEVKKFFDELAAIKIGANAWAQVSAEVMFTINWTNGMGQVRELKIGGQEVNDEHIYRIVTGDVLVYGKPHSLVPRYWTVLKNNEDKAQRLDVTVPNAIVDYVASRTQPYMPEIDGRILIEK